MSDLTKCPGINCPIKESCKRFTAPTTPLYQSVFVEVPGKWVKEDDNGLVWKCDMYWGERSESIMKQLMNIIK